MGVQLNIKDPETVRLARALAEATGQPVTQAIRQALERGLQELDTERGERLARLRNIVKDSRALWKPELLHVEIDELLYDEHGLPK